MKATDEVPYKVYTYIDPESPVYIEQNDLIILNVYTVKYIEILVYMF